MARVTYRANLSPKQIPFLSRDQGRSAIVVSYDQNYTRYLTTEATVERDVGAPQVYYAHNIVPIDAGIASVGYAQIVAGVSGKTFVNAWSVRMSGKDYKLGITTSGDFYLCSGSSLQWTLLKSLPDDAGKDVTVAIVRDNTYVQVSGAECYKLGNTEAPTTAPTASAGDAGSLTGDYKYLVVYVTAEGKTEAGIALDTAVSPSAQKVELTSIPVSPDSRVTAREIYRTTAGGTTYKLLTTIADNTTTTFSDNIADGSLGADAPTSNTTADGMIEQKLTGLTDGASPVYPNGICTYSGYLLAWKDNAVYWSSTIDPTDFTPDLSTGAGGGEVEAVKGRIVVVTAFANGLYLFTDKNVVAALYSSNVRYPFVFKEIAQSGGLSASQFVAKESLASKPYAYTSSGLQQISSAVGAEMVFPQATDFLTSGLMEDYVDSDGTLRLYSLANVMKKALAMISDRYLVISYGAASLTHALIYDQALTRWGKLRKDHVAVIEWDIVPPEATETPKNSMALLQADGTILIATQQAPGEAIALLGKYQYVRQRTIQLQEVVADNLTPDCTVYVIPNIGGKEGTRVPLVQISREGESFTFGASAVGLSVSVMFEGTFSLTSLVLSFNVHGTR